jgi:hypothetical protein
LQTEPVRKIFPDCAERRMVILAPTQDHDGGTDFILCCAARHRLKSMPLLKAETRF